MKRSQTKAGTSQTGGGQQAKTGQPAVPPAAKPEPAKPRRGQQTRDKAEPPLRPNRPIPAGTGFVVADRGFRLFHRCHCSVMRCARPVQRVHGYRSRPAWRGPRALCRPVLTRRRPDALKAKLGTRNGMVRPPDSQIPQEHSPYVRHSRNRRPAVKVAGAVVRRPDTCHHLPPPSAGDGRAGRHKRTRTVRGVARAIAATGWCATCSTRGRWRCWKAAPASRHCRYPTAGSEGSDEAQPFYVNSPFGIALAHNGNLMNTEALRREVFEQDRRNVNTELRFRGPAQRVRARAGPAEGADARTPFRRIAEA